MAANLLTALSISNFWNRTNNSLGNCVFCGSSSYYASLVDLSFNSGLGPEVPEVLGQSTTNTLTLVGVGITNINPGAFGGMVVSTLDLSLNDLFSGLHARSFDRIRWSSSAKLYLRNCRLRGSSLPQGVFEVSNAAEISLVTLFFNNINVDSSTDVAATTNNRLPFDPLPTRQLFSTQLFNPSGQPYAFRPPTLQQFEDSWGNFFDPFPAGVFYRTPVGATYQLIPFSIIRIGGEYMRPITPSRASRVRELLCFLTLSSSTAVNVVSLCACVQMWRRSRQTSWAT